jgi:hypothetical protein
LLQLIEVLFFEHHANRMNSVIFTAVVQGRRPTKRVEG